MNLDEPAGFDAVDSLDALGDLESLPAQWEEAFELPVPQAPAHDLVVVTGMGGSGIAGDVAAALAATSGGVPVTVHKGYGLPEFVGPGALVVAVSHSGRTAETIAAAQTALGRGASVVAISGGGELAELCTSHGAPVVSIPRRTPPRHALPLLSAPVLRLLGLAGEPGPVVAAVREVTVAGARDVPAEQNEVKRLASRIAVGSTPTVLGSQGLGAVAAYRAVCQLAENAKVAAIGGQVPEGAHNLAASWGHIDPRGGLLVLRDPAGEAPALAEHIRSVEELGGEAFDWTAELRAVGATALARLASLTAAVDLVSVYTALALDRDPTPIEQIDRIKAALGR